MMEIKSASENLELLVEAIQVPPSKYEDAATSYRSICNWLERDASTIKEQHRESYLQGSFRLGTAIRPTTDEDDYDLDIVVSFNHSTAQISQAELKRRLGIEIKAYANAHNMTHPKDGRRCWTQEYADERQFHVDTLPCIPDASGLRRKLSDRQMSQGFVEEAIGITDKTDANYNVVHPIWRNSNPRGYAAWFEGRMAVVLAERKAAIAKAEARSAGDIPTYRAQTPLQKAVQLLKYHRDVMFSDDLDDRPISIIITTLAAHAYNGERRLDAALAQILARMEDKIETVNSVKWVRNPSNAMENFADKWLEHPNRRDNFYKWLEAARGDFARIAAVAGNELNAVLKDVFGDETASRAFTGQAAPKSASKRASIVAPHRQSPGWPVHTTGAVKIKKATWRRKGQFRSRSISSDSFPVPKGVDVRFYAETDVAAPFEVYWQIVNTGEEAEQDNCLRGQFEDGEFQPGRLMRKESTAYKGTHTVECFIVKDGRLAARSGQFLLNVS